MKTQLLRLHEAAAKYNVSEQEITELIDQGKVDAYQVDDDCLVSADDVANVAADRLVKRESFAHLEGQPIGMSEAALKYRFHVGTISQWVTEERIKEIGPDPGHKQRRLINEADVAYLAALRDIKGIRPGRRLS